ISSAAASTIAVASSAVASRRSCGHPHRAKRRSRWCSPTRPTAFPTRTSTQSCSCSTGPSCSRPMRRTSSSDRSGPRSPRHRPWWAVGSAPRGIRSSSSWFAKNHPRFVEKEPALATALCPGSFDPVTNGHLDILERTARHFDDVVVAVSRNPQKSQSLFDLDERQEMLREVTAHLDNVSIETFTGLLVDFAEERGPHAIVKGLRAISDFDYELQMAQMNQQLTDIDTFFISTSPQYSFLSSSLVREVARFGGDVSSMVPKLVAERLAHRFDGRPKES